MKRLIIYGTGLRCEGIFGGVGGKGSFWQFLEKNDMLIVGFADGDIRKKNMDMRFGDDIYQVKTMEECLLEQFDYIVVTSNKYFQEIKDLLMKKGVEENKILQIDCIINTFLEDIYHIECYQEKSGVEIGGPSDVFKKIYDVCANCDGINFSEDTVWWKRKDTDEYIYKDKVLGKILIGDATDLRSIENDTYDFVISSNNLEHIANPLKALYEFYRILKPNGIVLVAVPIKEYTFDHRRSYTSFEHIVSDYEQGVQEGDLYHLNEIINLHDYAMDEPCGGREAFIERAKDNYLNRCLHHHVFSMDCLKQMCQYVGLSVMEIAEFYHNYFIVGRKNTAKQ